MLRTALLLSMLSSPVMADTNIDLFDNFGDFSKADASIIVGFGSKHYQDSEYLNESNPAIGVELWDIQAIYVSKNSFNKPSLYVAWSPEVYQTKYVDVALNIGFATNYDKTEIGRDGDNWMEFRFPSYMGLVPLGGVTAKVHLHENLDIKLTATYSVAMASIAYNF